MMFIIQSVTVLKYYLMSLNYNKTNKFINITYFMLVIIQGL